PMPTPHQHAQQGCWPSELLDEADLSDFSAWSDRSERPARSPPQRRRVPSFLILPMVLLMTLAPRTQCATPLTAPQREKLARLVQADAQAGRFFSKFRQVADAGLNDPPHPVQRIVTASKLASDPAKIESRAALEDIKKVEAFGTVCAVEHGPRYADAAKRMI